MPYLVLARKYRPSNFDEVTGQSHITDILKNAILSDRLGQAYLFCGPRGIGKTSCARILAKALNCEKGVTADPCGICPPCVSITQGNSFDVLEIDGASNRGIDEIRTIRENVKFSPSYGRYKVYIIDEVHMLTTEAFNALLKTLEEPPDHVKFIFATTDPNKLPATIISRCQRFDFRRISFRELCESLQKIAKKENIRVDQDALYAIAKAAKGSFRDALSILDQVGALSDRAITGGDIYDMLGLVDLEMVFQLVDALGACDCQTALKIFDDIIERGKDVKQLGKDLIEHFRHLMVIKLAGSSISKIREMGKLIDYPGEIKDLFLQQAQLFQLTEILAAIDIFIEAQDTARVTELERLPMEIAFAKLILTFNRPVLADGKGDEDKKKKNSSDADSRPVLSAGSIIKNQKGQVNASTGLPIEDDGDGVIEELGVDVVQPIGKSAEDLTMTLERVKGLWPALTHAVSRERMSLATYLQEGVPFCVDGSYLMIGFSPENAFFKESLESKENKHIVEKIFSEHLGVLVILKYEIVENAVAAVPEKESAVVKNVLDAFGGDIVNRWHNE
jgi:DNA polymerase-3 subunit gamma/tau